MVIMVIKIEPGYMTTHLMNVSLSDPNLGPNYDDISASLNLLPGIRHQ